MLTLKTWEIKDYTNRNDVKGFIYDYIADRWYLRGGLKILFVMILTCCIVVGILWLLFLLSREGNDTPPNPYIIGAVGCVCLSAILGIFIIAVFIVRAAEAVFVQYVSQNVNYTSAIILKRVVKSKIELAIGTVILIFLPVIYTLIRALMGKYLNYNYNHNSHFFFQININIISFHLISFNFIYSYY